MENTTNYDTMTRPEKRRAWKLLNKKDDYDESGFWDMSKYIGVKVRKSKYVPHFGNKEKGLANG